MIKVTIEGYGTFQIKPNTVGQLVAWLSQNEAVRIVENNTVYDVKNNTFTGKQLING
jgi:hypothetical protein